jgi:hypothetical protein
MSADTYLMVLDGVTVETYLTWRDGVPDPEGSPFPMVPPESESAMWALINETDRVWIGQGGGHDVDVCTPATVAFVTRLFWSAPVLTNGLAKTALSYMSMRNDSQYGTRMEHFHEGEVLDVNWHGPRGRSKFNPSRHNTCHRTRVVHGKQGSPRIITFRNRGVGAARPVKQFLERNIGKRIIPSVE